MLTEELWQWLRPVLFECSESLLLIATQLGQIIASQMVKNIGFEMLLQYST